jgi:hypothetical protein
VAASFVTAAVKRPGALTAKAKAAGMGVHAYALAHRMSKGLAGSQSRFYLNVLAPHSSRQKKRTSLARRLST